MTTLALDTNAYRALDDGNTHLTTLVREAAQLALPITVLGELYHGFYNGTRQQNNLLRLRRFISQPRLQILHIDELTTQLYGEIATQLQRAGKPIQQNDIWIAAICKQYNYTLATRDGGFQAILGLELVEF